MEGVEKDPLYRKGIEVVTVELSASLCLPDIDPVGRTVTGAGKPFLFDKGFQKDGPESIASVPVLGKLLGDPSEQSGGEIAKRNPGQDEESGVIDDEVKITLTLLCRPAYELIAWGNLPGCSTEAQCGK